MPGAEYGFKAAIIGLVTGFITSAAVNTVSLKLDTSGNYIVAIFNLFAIISMLMQFEKMNYWSLSYSLGYFVGISLFGRLFMESWELTLYLMVISIYILQKILKKIGV
mgnify:CR=1 FL=1